MKAGIKTTEFWFNLAAQVLNALVVTGAIPSGGVWEKVVLVAGTTLASLGYTVARTRAKEAAAYLAD